MRSIFALLLATVLAWSPALAQKPQETEQTSPPPVAAATEDAPSAGVVALELPPDQIVSSDEGFVTVTAKTKGKQVRWLIVSLTGGDKVKYLPIDLTNSVVVSVPKTQGAVIAVFAVANVDGELTDFARTTITVKGASPNPGPPPTPDPTPQPPQPVVQGPLHITFIVDVTKTTPALAQLINSKPLRDSITRNGAWFRVYPSDHQSLGPKRIDVIYRKVNAPAMMLIQDNKGNVLDASPVPATQQDILNKIASAAGGGR